MRTVSEAIAWGRAQIDHPTQSWACLCQSFVRQCYGVGAWAPSAYDAWLKIPDSKKARGGHPSDAPRGAALYYKHTTGNPRPGHVVIATKSNCLSNDIYRHGKIDVAPRGVFEGAWHMTYLGWSLWTPQGELRTSA
jgi:hypothetical protein